MSIKTEYKCNACNYSCGNRKSSYLSHLKSKKHIEKSNGDNISVDSDITDSNDNNPSQHHHEPRQNNDVQLYFILQEITLLKSQNLLFQNEINNLKCNISSLETKLQIFQNNEIQNIKFAQQIQQIQQIQQATKYIPPPQPQSQPQSEQQTLPKRRKRINIKKKL